MVEEDIEINKVWQTPKGTQNQKAYQKRFQSLLASSKKHVIFRRGPGKLNKKTYLPAALQIKKMYTLPRLHLQIHKNKPCHCSAGKIKKIVHIVRSTCILNRVFQLCNLL